MEIRLQGLGKKFLRDWIFRDLDFHFATSGFYALTGPNGSGKSTLLRILSGQLSPNAGTVEWRDESRTIPVSSVYQNLTFAAPYLELVEEFSLREMLDFHKQFRSFRDQRTTSDVLEALGMQAHQDKEIRHFSSGMKQRVKLALAFLSQSDLVLLDEPSTNLDDQGFEWYRDLMLQNRDNRLLIIASNRPAEYEGCEKTLQLSSSSAVKL